MSAVENFERVRMALAEVGYGNANAWLEGEQGYFDPLSVPPRVMWQAVVVARVPSGRCWECFQVGGDYRCCLAPGLGIEDCGAERAS